MGRAPRQLTDSCSFHITLRCNSRAFLISRGVRRDLLQPPQGKDLPRMFTGCCGRIWEAQYFSTPIEPGEPRRVLATLGTIHASTKASGMRQALQ